MKKTLLVLPTLLLLAAPVAALAEKDNHDNHGAQVSVVARERGEDHGSKVSEVAKDNHGANLGNKENDEDEDNEIEREDHHKIATVSAHGREQLKIKIKITGNRPGATISATPSAQIKVSGPLDQVVKALESILNFLKSLV